jgi:hypothetical protein
MSKKSNAVRKSEVTPMDPVEKLLHDDEVITETHAEDQQAATTEVVAPTMAPKIEGTQVELIAKYGNKSGAIRALNSQGFKTADIARALDIRYQHVRNVLTQPLKRVIKEERAKATEATEATEASVTGTA